MYEVQISAWGEIPKYVANTLSAPEPPNNEVQIMPIAVGIHRVVRSRAGGKHYSSSSLPHIPGVDGVGYVVPTNELVFFITFARGTMSQLINIPKHSVYALPAGADPFQIAASINPAMSSWMALQARTNNLPPDFTVLILGATSASGRLAISLARSLGAKHILGAARNESALRRLDGLDQAIVVRDDPAQTDFSNIGAVDVILDYIYGNLTLHLFRKLETPRPVQYIHIGGLSGQMEIDMPGSLLRGKNITLRGSGPGAWTMEELAKTMPRLLQAAAEFPPRPIRVVKFENVESEWEYDGPERLVFTP